MICKTYEIEVPGQKTGAAELDVYCLAPHVAGAKRGGVLILPGGGYRHVSPREGEPVAMALAAMGYHTFVLRYSVAPNVYPTALKETEKAFDLIRENARTWELDEDKLYLMGFSAGGHLALDYAEERPAAAVSPCGLILCYPVVSSGEYAHRGSFDEVIGAERSEREAAELLESLSLEKHVDASKVPPVFLWTTWTDGSVPVENSLLLANALRTAGVNTEMHIYSEGPHGLSLANELTSTDKAQIVPPVQSWIGLLGTWLKNREERV